MYYPIRKRNQLALALTSALALAFPTAVFAAADEAEVVVTATRQTQKISDTIAHTTVITEKEIRASMAVDVPSLLRREAGIEIAQAGGLGKQSGLFMRGTESNHTLVLIDGIRAGSVTTGATALDQIMLDQVERIEIVRGNMSAIYGSEAIGGVVQIFTRRGRGKPTLDLRAGYGRYDTSRVAASYGGEIGDTQLSVSLSDSRTDGFSAIDAAKAPSANPDNDGYRNTSGSFSLTHALNANHKLGLRLFDSNGRVEYDNNFDAPTDRHDAKTVVRSFSVFSENRFADWCTSKLTLGQGVDRNDAFLNGAETSRTRSTQNQINWHNDLVFAPGQRASLGFENLRQKVDSTTAYTRDTRRVNSAYAGYSGSFGVHQFQVNARHDRYSDFGNKNTGFLGYGLNLSPQWRASASLSTAFVAPTFNDLFFPDFSNPNLLPERARSAEIGVQYEAGVNRVKVVAFHNRIRDLIGFDFTAPNPVVNINRAKIEGLELSWRGKLYAVDVNANLTLQNPRDETTGLQLVRRSRQLANLSLQHAQGPWRAGGEWRLSGSRPDFDINTFARKTLPGYQVVNLTAGYTLAKNLELSLRLDNAFDKKYQLVDGYNTSGRALFAQLSWR